MGLAILSSALIWVSVLIERAKRYKTRSSLEDFGILVLQILLISIGLVLARENPFLSLCLDF